MQAMALHFLQAHTTVAIAFGLTMAPGLSGDHHMTQSPSATGDHSNDTDGYHHTTVSSDVMEAEMHNEGLQCFQCEGLFINCGRKQRSGDQVTVCRTGQSCKLGRYGDKPSTFNYFRDCYDKKCETGMEEMHCMHHGKNSTCLRCCSSNRCNADAFDNSTSISATYHPFILWASVLSALVLHSMMLLLC